MFLNPFSFKGRIRRLEYGLSIIFFYLYILLAGVFIGFLGFVGVPEILAILAFIPGYWFLWAQGCKRSHDLGNSGWYQLIPFYPLVLLFAGSEYGENDYGPNPKGIGNENVEEMIDNIGSPYKEEI